MTEQSSPISGASVLRVLHPVRISGVYLLVVVCVIFSLWVPSTFAHVDTIWQVLNSNALAALAALALVMPLATGVFDISVPYTITLSGAVCTYAIVTTGWPIWAAVVLGVLAALLVGVVNSVLVVVLKIESLIATIASGFVVQAVILWRTNNSIISGTRLNGSFRKIAYAQVVGRLTLPVVYVVVAAASIGVLLQLTATGRRMYATGFNVEAARLAGVRTGRLRVAALLLSALMAGLIGVVLAANTGSGSTSGGTALLLPAFAGVFLGATQLTPGRFNPWGTVLATVLLGVIITGLGLANQPQWIQQLVSGLVLLVALAVARFETLGRRSNTHVTRGADATLATDDEPIAAAASPSRTTPRDRPSAARESAD